MPQEVAAFPEYYAEYFKQAMMGGAIVSLAPVVCVGPIKYRGEAFVKRDIDNVKRAAAAAGVPDHHVFLPATAASGVGINEYYKSDEEYFHALAAELAKEYRAIVDAGILVQIDDPFLPDIFFEPDLDRAQIRRRAEIYVEATNAALDGIAPEKVRFHTCYGINEGPRLYEAALSDIIEYVLKINAGSYSFEAANPRHEHEYHLFERIKLADGKVLCPGMITHASNIVEHPELIAERIMRFAKLVGRENVIAAADCGFSSQALYRTEVHPDRGLGEIQGAAPRCRPRHQEVVEMMSSSRAKRSDPGRCGNGWIASSLALLAVTSVLLAALPARADDVASFYRGKQVRFIVGSAAGGTYDLLARIVARHMGAHIPGDPLIIVQNQPTAGGLAMVNQLYALGPKDGTVDRRAAQRHSGGAAVAAARRAHFDAAKLIWLGSHPQRAVRRLCLAHRAGAEPRRGVDQTARRRRHHAGHHHERFPAC